MTSTTTLQRFDTFTIPRRISSKGTPEVYEVKVEVLDHHSRYVIHLGDKPIRKQITRPNVSDCEQGEFDSRAGATPKGFTP
jgi:hypothetical protein